MPENRLRPSSKAACLFSSSIPDTTSPRRWSAAIATSVLMASTIPCRSLPLGSTAVYENSAMLEQFFEHFRVERERVCVLDGDFTTRNELGEGPVHIDHTLFG